MRVSSSAVFCVKHLSLTAMWIKNKKVVFLYWCHPTCNRKQRQNNCSRSSCSNGGGWRIRKHAKSFIYNNLSPNPIARGTRNVHWSQSSSVPRECFSLELGSLLCSMFWKALSMFAVQWLLLLSSCLQKFGGPEASFHSKLSFPFQSRWVRLL